MYFKLEIVTQGIVLLYAFYFSFKHMMSPNYNPCKKFFAFLVFLSSIWLISHRDTFLPFLGFTVLPPSAIKNSLTIDGANVEIELSFDVKDGTRIIFWGAKTNSITQPNPKIAYSDYTNVGITTIQNGKAILHFNCPGQYKVGPGYTLPRHIHYRLVMDSGIITPVKTKEVHC